jgi:hypothetical protein
MYAKGTIIWVLYLPFLSPLVNNIINIIFKFISTLVKENRLGPLKSCDLEESFVRVRIF